jgi:hypothetical protein
MLLNNEKSIIEAYQALLQHYDYINHETPINLDSVQAFKEMCSNAEFLTCDLNVLAHNTVTKELSALRPTKFKEGLDLIDDPNAIIVLTEPAKLESFFDVSLLSGKEAIFRFTMNQKQVNNLSLKLNLTEMQEEKLEQLEDEVMEMEELRDKFETILDNMQNTIMEFDFSMEILNHNLEKLKKRIGT